MTSLSPDPSASPASGHGLLIALATLLETAAIPLAVCGAMLFRDRFDPMCGAGGEGGIACATRAFVVTMMSVLPGLLVGVGDRAVSRVPARRTGCGE